MWIMFFIMYKQLPPAYIIRIVNRAKDLPTKGRKIKIPGSSSGLICVVPEHGKEPDYLDNPSQLLDIISNKCIQVISDDGTLTYCINGEVYLGTKSYGFVNSYKWKNGILSSLTEKGEICPYGGNYSFYATYQCDHTVKPPFSISAFWETDNCTYSTVVKTPYLCKHVDLSHESIFTIKCISKATYDLGNAPHLY